MLKKTLLASILFIPFASAQAAEIPDSATLNFRSSIGIPATMTFNAAAITTPLPPISMCQNTKFVLKAVAQLWTNNCTQRIIATHAMVNCMLQRSLPKDRLCWAKLTTNMWNAYQGSCWTCSRCRGNWRSPMANWLPTHKLPMAKKCIESAS